MDLTTLADAREWLHQTLADPKRAHSLTAHGRTAGVFTAGTRGGKAPTLVTKDFINVALAALSLAGPRSLHVDLPRLRDLKLVLVSIDLNDGAWWRGHLPEGLPHEIKETLHGLGIAQVRDHEQLSAVLAGLLAAGRAKADFHDADKIELLEHGDHLRATITLYEAGWGMDATGWPEQGPGQSAIQLVFENVAERDDRLIETRRVLRAPALRALAEIANNAGEGA